MNSETHENESLAKRLEKLQKEIRWIKGSASLLPPWWLGSF